ncbi:MAG: transporter permease [Herbinix sp.]|jgi:ABC-2 type transport system permease protein|nr:transporter permease [Herbinix sp.]
MQVFKAYYKILKSQLTAVLIYVALFLMLTILFTGNLKDNSNQFETKKVPVMVINEDGQNGLLDSFLSYLEEYVVYVEPKAGADAIKDALYYREVSYIITIPKGFSDSFYENGEINLTKQAAPDSMEAITIDQAIDNYFNIARVYQGHLPETTAEEISSYVQANLKEQTRVHLYGEQKDSVSAGHSFNRFYYNYLGYIIVAAFITSVSTIMFSFHGLDIRRRHFASPITERNLNGQLILANMIFVIFYLVIFIVAGYALNKYRAVNTNTLLFWLNAFTFALVTLSISYLIGISVKSKKAISALSTAVSLGIAFLSGMFVPQEFLGAPVLKVASFTPAYWFVKANGAIETLTTSSWSEISKIASFMAIQLGFAAAIISIALVVSKRKRQQIS